MATMRLDEVEGEMTRMGRVDRPRETRRGQVASHYVLRSVPSTLPRGAIREQPLPAAAVSADVAGVLAALSGSPQKGHAINGTLITLAQNAAVNVETLMHTIRALDAGVAVPTSTSGEARTTSHGRAGSMPVGIASTMRVPAGGTEPLTVSELSSPAPPPMLGGPAVTRRGNPPPQRARSMQPWPQASASASTQSMADIRAEAEAKVRAELAAEAEAEAQAAAQAEAEAAARVRQEAENAELRRRAAELEHRLSALEAVTEESLASPGRASERQVMYDVAASPVSSMVEDELRWRAAQLEERLSQLEVVEARRKLSASERSGHDALLREQQAVLAHQRQLLAQQQALEANMAAQEEELSESRAELGRREAELNAVLDRLLPGGDAGPVVAVHAPVYRGDVHQVEQAGHTEVASLTKSAPETESAPVNAPAPTVCEAVRVPGREAAHVEIARMVMEPAKASMEEVARVSEPRAVATPERIRVSMPNNVTAASQTEAVEAVGAAIQTEAVEVVGAAIQTEAVAATEVSRVRSRPQPAPAVPVASCASDEEEDESADDRLAKTCYDDERLWLGEARSVVRRINAPTLASMHQHYGSEEGKIGPAGRIITVPRLSEAEVRFIADVRSRYAPPAAVASRAEAEGVPVEHVVTGHEFDMLVEIRRADDASAARVAKLRALGVLTPAQSTRLPRGYGQAILKTDVARPYFQFAHMDAASRAAGSAAVAATMRWSDSLRRPPSESLKAEAIAQARAEQRQELARLLRERDG
ncbi:hypothetical protein, variant [Thecamonas trahens ATCC 50062]|uniref:Uncharacterized protein n=1 Tax=Thecamonas trahens ATCC 50062 TaxID=461836 RepID=A0A0L0DF47_THETB|nr:hypothetical protein, variant [Thecamonas trahens ATCC 50062]KNC49943.1 hypothetical protein, variant [Thecamonas trahens ATCC 50062]|eukprot:XP_013757420.1 hypothetical protein, variant [Thecamonas trahens ATCC 50062]